MKSKYILGVLAGIVGLFLLRPLLMQEDKIDFNTQVRPILNQNCLVCHGGVRQQSDLSFLFMEEALRPAKSGKKAIVPGSPTKSELVHRITSKDADKVMPPDRKSLRVEEVEILKKWIAQGAEWKEHWAYLPPVVKTSLPEHQKEWCLNEIDQYILTTLQAENLNPSKRAEKTTLIRRLSLDLIGLPPTLEETKQFLADTNPDAYKHLVDRLLSSPHFGERWASMWLDLARYADSKGYQKDLLRKDIWRYRDWVIDAFNKDMPFDQFTIEQLAGDLLSNPNDNQLLATAFHRNTMTNDEGGTDDEEFRVAAVLDRLNTTFEIWQGTTMACVQCHSHPYDPIRHEEFYHLYAFFNNTKDADNGRDSPLKSLYSPAQKSIKNKYDLL